MTLAQLEMQFCIGNSHFTGGIKYDSSTVITLSFGYSRFASTVCSAICFVFREKPTNIKEMGLTFVFLDGTKSPSGNTTPRLGETKN